MRMLSLRELYSKWVKNSLSLNQNVPSEEISVQSVSCAPLFVFEFPASFSYEGHCAEVNSQYLSFVFTGHCEFTYAQCPGTQTEARNSNTNRDESHTLCKE